ncbi:Immunoglobulin I-set [Trinorchestia longiramus]|nr:Immunoglobulin I-set [Trinorchestia longiramus]
MSQSDALDPLALLENLDGWVLGCLEEELSRDDTWQVLAKNITSAGGSKIYSVSDLSRLKQSSRPAADVIQGLVQRGLSLANLLQLLQQTNLVHLYSVLTPKKVARITGQSHEGLVTVQAGRSVSVSVYTEGNPPPQLVWYRGDTPLLHNTSHTLTLPHFGPQDEGIYLCLVRQLVPPDSPQWGENSGQYLELWSSPLEFCLEDVAPSFSVQPVNVTLDCGQRLKLTCRCDSAHPPPRFSWYKEGQLVLTSDTPSLTIESVEEYDSGRYWCVATNSAGHTTSHRCTVTVSEVVSPHCEPPVVVRQPRVWCSDGVVSRGQPVQLWCTVRSTAPVTFAWTRNGHVLHGTSSSCHSIMSSQEGEGDIFSSCLLYTPLDSDSSVLRLICVVSNSAGQVVSQEAVVQVKELDLAPRVYTAGRKWALLVANCRYEGKPLLTTLPDCQRIAATLTQLDFRCLVLANLSLSHFRNAVSLMCGFVQRGDYVVFYYGGHGYHDNGDRMIAVDGCDGTASEEHAEEAGLRAGCLSPVWVRNAFLRPQPALLFIVLDMCRTTLHDAGLVSASSSNSREQLPSAARCSVVLHGTSVRCAALEAPDSMSVLTKHLLRRLDTHASQPLTSLAASVLQGVCGDSSRVREEQFPVLEADLALPRTLADCITAPAGESCITAPAGESCITAPAGESCITAPAGESCITAPAGESCITAPAGESCITAPAGEGCITAPAGEGCITAPAGESCITAPAGESCITAPAGESCITAPAGEGCITAPAGAVVERWKQMLSVGNVVTAETWIPFTSRQDSSPSLSSREEHRGTDSDTRNNSDSNSSTQDDRDDSFEKKFEAYMAEELEGLNISKMGFIRRNKYNKECRSKNSECETSELHSSSTSVPLLAAQSKVLSEEPREFTKHQLTTLVRPDLTSVVLKDNKISGTRVRVRGRVSLLSGDHPVGNIALVRVAVDFAGLPVLYKVALEALGCRLVRVSCEQPQLTVYRVEDLHCLAAPLAATVTFSRCKSSLKDERMNCPVYESHQTGSKHAADTSGPYSNNLSVSGNSLNSSSHLTAQNKSASENCGYPPASISVSDSELLFTSKSKVRLSFGLPSLAKTNLQVNDLRGSCLEEAGGCNDTSQISYDLVNIAF